MPQPQTPRPPKPRFLDGLTRGLAQRCPECGRGHLFEGYLKVRPLCEVCGHDNGQYPADDAPPYFTILIVGHLVVAPLLAFPFIWKANVWLVVGTTLPALFILTLVLLPRVKGAVVGFHWAMDDAAKTKRAAATHQFGTAP